MKQTRFFLVLFVAIISLASLSVAQESMKGEKKDMMMHKDMKTTMSQTYTGYLVDKMCGVGFAGSDMKSADEEAMKHTTFCALEDECRESGYGLLLDGKYYKFDARGDELALEYLTGTSKKSNLKVEVVGSISDDGIAVTSLGEVMMKNDMKDAM